MLDKIEAVVAPSHAVVDELLKLIAAKAKENQIRKPESVSQKSDKQIPIDTKKEIAKAANVSHAGESIDVKSIMRSSFNGSPPHAVVDAAIARGEVTATLKGTYQVGKSGIAGAEVDRWRKLASTHSQRGMSTLMSDGR